MNWELPKDPDLLKLYGVKASSYLNCLKYYHVVDGLPPDPAHNLFEGFCVDMTNLVIHYAKILEDLNSVILSFDYADIDKSNIPVSKNQGFDKISY